MESLAPLRSPSTPVSLLASSLARRISVSRVVRSQTSRDQLRAFLASTSRKSAAKEERIVIRRILLAVNAGNDSRHAEALAAELGEGLEAEVTVLHVRVPASASSSRSVRITGPSARAPGSASSWF